MYAATGDERFKERADYIVNEMKEVQDKHGDGYLGALMGNKPGVRPRAAAARGRRIWPTAASCSSCYREGEIRSGGFDLNGMWSPWYTLHKTYAGLRDAYRFTGQQDRSGSWKSSSPSGPRRFWRRSTTSRSSGCSTPSSAA